MNARLSVGSKAEIILAEAKRIALSAPEICIGFVVLLTGAAVVVDTLGLVGAGDFTLALLNLGAGYLMTSLLLTRSRVAEAKLVGGFGLYFGLSLLMGIAIVFGFLLLVLPGFFLIVRWLPAYGFALNEGGSVSDALGKAWAATESHFWSLAIAQILPIALMVGGIFAIFWWSDVEDTVSMPVSAVSNALIYASTVANTCVGLAAYSLWGGTTETLEDVFD